MYDAKTLLFLSTSKLADWEILEQFSVENLQIQGTEWETEEFQENQEITQE